MKNCDHVLIRTKDQRKEFLGRFFYYKTDTCEECGAAMWNNQINNEFREWLKQLFQNEPNLFKLEYHLNYLENDEIEKIFQNFNSDLHLNDIFMKCFDFINKNQLDLKFRPSTPLGVKVKKLIEFTPEQMIQINSFTKISNMSYSAFISQILRITLLIHKDKTLFNKLII